MIEDVWRTLNARQEPNSTLVKGYVDNDFYWQRFSPVNEIIIGTGGSGKTAMLKMMSLSLLSDYDNHKAKEIIEERKYIGIYIPLMLYLGNINEIEHLTESIQKTFFTKAFNIISCKSFITTILKYIDLYSTNKEIDVKSVHSLLKELWMSSNYKGDDLLELKHALSSDWLTLQSDVRKSQYDDDEKNSYKFKNMSFFSPISIAIESIKDMLNVNDSTYFLVLIDEAEFLSDFQRKEINTLMRSEKIPFVFKIATVPFIHTNLETINKDIVLRENQDFQFVSIDKFFTANASKKFSEFAKKVIDLRLKEDKGWNAEKIIKFLRKRDYANEAVRIVKEFNTFDDLDEAFIKSLTPGRRRSVIELRKKNKGKRDNKITNKFLPVFCTKYIHEYYKQMSHSKPSYYFGFDLLIKISEGNIRNFIKIMNRISVLLDDGKMLSEDESNFKQKLTSLAGEQNTLLVELANKEYDITKNLCGKDSFLYFDLICKSLRMKFYQRDYITPYGTSFQLSKDDLDSHKVEIVSLIKEGRIIPSSYDFVSVDESGPKWRISYLFALKYWIHMRWGNPLYSRNFLKRSKEADISQLELGLTNEL